MPAHALLIAAAVDCAGDPVALLLLRRVDGFEVVQRAVPRLRDHDQHQIQPRDLQGIFDMIVHA